MSTVNGGWRGPNIVKDGLAFYLDAGSPNSFYLPTADVTWKDISGNGNNGILTNGPTFNPENGGSIVFDGVDDYISCPKQTYLANATQFTMFAWVKRKLSNSLVIIGQIETLSNDISFELWTDNNAYFEVGNGSNSYGVTPNNSTAWQYLTMVFDGTQTGNSNRLKAYTNGVLQTLTYSGTIPATTGTMNTNLIIGAYVPNNNWSNGNISQTLIYNRALNASEVLQNFNATRARFGI
jgi:hypothetical protein